jgi:threonine/homoserine/homoserine lactone efflux protein
MPPDLEAFLWGFAAGFAVSVPVGPINLTIMNDGARRGFRHAALIAAGATLMEALYCTLAFTSFRALVQGPVVKAVLGLFSFAFMLFLGVRFLLTKSVPVVDRFEEKLEHTIEAGIERRFHPTSAFMTGFVQTLANPGVLLCWIVLGALFISRGWVEPTWRSKLLCVAGVTGGVGAWCFGLAWAAALGHGRFSEKTLLRMARASGIGLIALGLAHGGKLVLDLAHRYGALGP